MHDFIICMMYCLDSGPIWVHVRADMGSILIWNHEPFRPGLRSKSLLFLVKRDKSNRKAMNRNWSNQ